ncbi:hypothetical protein [Halovenus salina]|uniref:Uncharacterized protein n=1 Tax=Halovenus salina TaxID=1510225 RepID=A0ABD5W858_9EURY
MQEPDEPGRQRNQGGSGIDYHAEGEDTADETDRRTSERNPTALAGQGMVVVLAASVEVDVAVFDVCRVDGTEHRRHVDGSDAEPELARDDGSEPGSRERRQHKHGMDLGAKRTQVCSEASRVACNCHMSTLSRCRISLSVGARPPRL